MKELLILLRQLKKNRSGYVSHGELGLVIEKVLMAIAFEEMKEAERKLNTD